MPVTPSKSPSVPERLTEAARQLEKARVAQMEAAKALDCDLIPTSTHRECLFAMDATRDVEGSIVDLYVGLRGNR